MKLLSLYVEVILKLCQGVLNYTEFIDLCEPFLENNQDIFNVLKQITFSKMMNRRHYSLINKPLSELDLTSNTFLYLETVRVCHSYSELPDDFPIPICSGRDVKLGKILNDKYISIPNGSEDDKTNSLKKNHYEENIFKFEDQRFEIDMMIETCKSAIESLNNLMESIDSRPNMKIEEQLSSTQIKLIRRIYKELGDQIVENMNSKPKKTIPVLITRFKKKIEDTLNQKIDLDKSIKLSFDRYYTKSFDYRSFKFKNFEKKNTNAKAFIKEIKTKKKEKSTTSNINILKGGNENCEFYSTMPLKSLKEIFNNRIKDTEDDILLINVDLNNVVMKKKLPEFRIIFENKEILKITIYMIFYFLVFSNNYQDHSVFLFNFLENS